MLCGIKAIIRNVCVITDGHKGDGQNAALIAENRDSSTERRGNLFFAYQPSHVLVHTEIADLISRTAVARNDIAYYFIRSKIHPYCFFVNIFLAL